MNSGLFENLASNKTDYRRKIKKALLIMKSGKSVASNP